MHEYKFYYWDEPHLYKRGPGHIFYYHNVMNHRMESILLAKELTLRYFNVDILLAKKLTHISLKFRQVSQHLSTFNHHQWSHLNPNLNLRALKLKSPTPMLFPLDKMTKVSCLPLVIIQGPFTFPIPNFQFDYIMVPNHYN